MLSGPIHNGSSSLTQLIFISLYRARRLQLYKRTSFIHFFSINLLIFIFILFLSPLSCLTCHKNTYIHIYDTIWAPPPKRDDFANCDRFWQLWEPSIPRDINRTQKKSTTCPCMMTQENSQVYFLNSESPNWSTLLNKDKTNLDID